MRLILYHLFFYCIFVHNFTGLLLRSWCFQRVIGRASRWQSALIIVQTLVTRQRHIDSLDVAFYIQLSCALFIAPIKLLFWTVVSADEYILKAPD